MYSRNMRAHNVNVRSFILRSAAAATTGRERTGRRRVKKKNHHKNIHTTKGQQAINHVRAQFLYYVNDERNTHRYI